MIAGRPLLFLSLPGLALIVGLVWYRRKYKPDVGDSRGGEKRRGDECESTVGGASCHAELEPDVRQSSSLPIQSVGSSNGAMENWDNCSGSGQSSAGSSRSAPIDIVPNKSPSKGGDAGLCDPFGHSRLVDDQEEFSFSPSVDLPDSVSRYKPNLRKFNQMLEKAQEPVIIRPTKPASLQSCQFKVADANGNSTPVKPKQKSQPKSQTKAKAQQQQQTQTQSQQQPQKQQQTASDKANGNTVTGSGNAALDKRNHEEEAFDERTEQTASPPLSICSVRSEDSGKGSSPPHSVGHANSIYEFLLPAYLVAGMLGKEGTFVKQIKQKTGVNVIIKRNPNTHTSKICTLQGSPDDIQTALKMIRQKFPQKRFPTLSLKRIEISRVEAVIPISLMNETCSSLPLVEGINNDVAVSCIVSVGHLFVHQPLHPTYLKLTAMQHALNESYSVSEAPQLPEIVPNAVCVACVAGNWYRAQVMQHVTETDQVLVKYLDYGGYSSLPVQSLRQIRKDFIAVPFQSIECVLSNIQPIDESQNSWSEDATDLFRRLTNGVVMQAQVAGYTAEGLPEIYLYSSIAKDNVVFINQEMVARGFARWID
ncbi:a kinase anchor protein [Anopheles darlingi]|uniref:A kinase anchor protein n=1 Tax=Anopheles darlingi TaxID=43151 RepID=W5J2E6_ANODA|nr:KH domain-containing protein akap-1 [Anopheles darlingi]XP_049529937.1 KH domain-containing protein akap-1 [Anopheles darlingi]ETN58422.1 a kinase anchor protein [Anopheles darlingi]